MLFEMETLLCCLLRELTKLLICWCQKVGVLKENFHMVFSLQFSLNFHSSNVFVCAFCWLPQILQIQRDFSLVCFQHSITSWLFERDCYSYVLIFISVAKGLLLIFMVKDSDPCGVSCQFGFHGWRIFHLNFANEQRDEKVRIGIKVWGEHWQRRKKASHRTVSLPGRLAWCRRPANTLFCILQRSLTPNAGIQTLVFF